MAAHSELIQKYDIISLLAWELYLDENVIYLLLLIILIYRQSVEMVCLAIIIMKVAQKLTGTIQSKPMCKM